MTRGWSRAIVITPRAGGADGISTVTRMYATTLAAHLGPGAMLEVWSLDEHTRPDALDDDEIGFHGAGGSRARFAGWGMTATADRGTLVVVQHIHLAPIALPLAWRGAHIMLVLHGVEAWKPLRGPERAAFRAAWKVAAVSHHTAGRFRAANPALARIPIDVCAPGVPAAMDGAAGGAAGRYALIVGRMAADERYKGHDLLLDAWPAVRRVVPDARLVIVGDGDDRERLSERARALGLGEAVRFEGLVSGARLAALYREAAVFVMPSPNEGFGLVYVEAMSAGVPCIVAPGAAEEIVEDGASGFVVPPGDAVALHRAIVRCFTDPAERARMGAAAAETARRRFSADAFASRLGSLLQPPGVRAAC